MAHYLVTGGAGFIGSHLVDALVIAGHKVTVLDNYSAGKETFSAEVNCIVGSICDAQIIEKIFSTIDGCFHLAAIPSVVRSNEAWIETHAVNLTGTITIFNAAKKMAAQKIIPVVYASSSAVYGDNPHHPATESDHPTPISAYGADKYACELQARIAGLVHQLPTFGLRFFNVYGPRQRPDSPYSGVISLFMKNFQEKTPLTIYGDGLQSRDFIYVSDVVAHCIAAMNNTSINAPVVNVCHGQATPLLSLVDLLSHIFGYRPEVKFATARKGDIYCSYGSPELAIQQLGLTTTVSLEQGLLQLLTRET